MPPRGGGIFLIVRLPATRTTGEPVRRLISGQTDDAKRGPVERKAGEKATVHIPNSSELASISGSRSMSASRSSSSNRRILHEVLDRATHNRPVVPLRSAALVSVVALLRVAT
jgi:hypothetical protein